MDSNNTHQMAPLSFPLIKSLKRIKEIHSVFPQLNMMSCIAVFGADLRFRRSSSALPSSDHLVIFS